MMHEIKGENNRLLVFTVSEKEREWLRQQKEELGDDFGKDDFLYDMFESFVSNSEFEWTNSNATFDMISDYCPMLCISGPEYSGNLGREHPGYLHTGFNGKHHLYSPILQRWAYMNYAIDNPQDSLLESGCAVFEGGDFVSEDDCEKDGLTLVPDDDFVADDRVSDDVSVPTIVETNPNGGNV